MVWHREEQETEQRQSMCPLIYLFNQEWIFNFESCWTKNGIWIKLFNNKKWDTLQDSQRFPFIAHMRTSVHVSQNRIILSSYKQCLELEQWGAVVPCIELVIVLRLNNFVLYVGRHFTWFHIKQHSNYVRFFLFTSHVLKRLANCLKAFCILSSIFRYYRVLLFLQSRKMHTVNPLL